MTQCDDWNAAQGRRVARTQLPVAPTPPAYGTQPDMVNHPAHYNHGKIEVIDVIEDWNLNFNLGSAVKYIGRADHKNNPIEDLEKAVWYLQREIARRKKGANYV